jgi:hypothetical protein
MDLNEQYAKNILFCSSTLGVPVSNPEVSVCSLKVLSSEMDPAEIRLIR